MIPLCDVTKQYEELKAQIDDAIADVLSKGRYILGPHVRAFEDEVCDFLGCRHAVGVNSGTDALYLALRATGIGPGDEVITTPFTFIATTEAISMVGARPVFADIDLVTYNIDPAKIERAITSKTRAILPVHLYGRPCNMEAIVEIAKRYELRIIEDCAQSMGAKFNGQQTGTFGDAGCLSFFPSKNLGCMGDGGMIVTNDTALYERAEMLRRHGGKVKYYHTELGVNSRLDEVQAAILRVKLAHLDRWNQYRNDVAFRYQHEIRLGRVTQLPPMSDETYASVFHQYTVLVADRCKLASQLTEAGVGNAIYYPIPLHLQTVNQSLPYSCGDFPNAEFAADACLSLPISSHLSEKDQSAVVAALESSRQLAA